MQTNTLYSSPQWQEILQHNNLNTFADWWQLELDAVDEGNTGRGGWSKVAIHALELPDGGQRRVVIKRQCNYRSRTLRHLLRGVATFEKEYNFIRLYQQCGVPATTAVYCATRQDNGDLQAILVTEFMDEHRSLLDIIDATDQGATLPRTERDAIIRCMARLLRRLHQHHIAHRCLYPKHIFIPTDPNNGQARLIDLEKSRRIPWRNNCAISDLATFGRRTLCINSRDIVVFLRTYCDCPRLDNKARRLYAAITKRISGKR